MNNDFFIQILLLRLTLFLIIIILFKEYKTILTQFKKIKKKYLYILILIFIYSFFLRTYYSPLNYFHENWHGYENIENAIYLKGYHLYGSSYYTFFNFFYLFMQKNETSIFTLNAILGSLSVLLIFLLTYQLYNNENISLYSTLLLGVFPIYIRLSSSESFFVLVVFFMLLTLNSFLLYIRTNNTYIYILSLLLLNFTIQIRPLLIFFPFIIILLLIIYDKNFLNKLKDYKLWIFTFLFLLLILKHCFLLLNIIIKKDQPDVYNFNPFKFITFLVSSKYNIALNIKYFPFIIFAFTLIGSIFLIIKKEKSFLFLISYLFLFKYLYLSISSCYIARIRVQSSFLFLLLILAGYGIFCISDLINNKIIKICYHLIIILYCISIPFIYYNFIKTLNNPQIEYNFIKNNIKYLPDKGILIINNHAEKKLISTYFPYWLLKQKNKNIKIIRLNYFHKNAEKLFNNNENILFFQGTTFYSFHKRELESLEFNKDEIINLNRTKDKYIRKQLIDLKNEYNFIPIKEKIFNNNPYGFEIVPQKDLTIGFYYLNKK